jgi:hypothetical protein
VYKPNSVAKGVDLCAVGGVVSIDNTDYSVVVIAPQHLGCFKVTRVEGFKSKLWVRRDGRLGAAWNVVDGGCTVSIQQIVADVLADRIVIAKHGWRKPDTL